MTDDKFDLFVTVDQNLRYQQNLAKLILTIVIFCAVDNLRETLKILIPKLCARLEAGNLQNLIEIS